jgi:hypothetical protein
MGTAFAEAALMLGQNLSKATATAKLQQAQSANAKLQAKVQNLTLRPKVGGIYARRQSVPSLGAALGRSNGSNASDPLGNSSGVVGAVGSASGGVSGALRQLPDAYPVDLRRGVDHKKVPSSSGWVVIDNPAFDFPIYAPSLDGDETMGPDYITVPVSIGGSYLYDKYQKNQAQLKRQGGPMPLDKAAQVNSWSLAGKRGKPLPRPNQGRGGSLNYRMGY